MIFLKSDFIFIKNNNLFKIKTNKRVIDWKLPKYYINKKKLMAKMKSKKILKNGDVASFIDVGKLLKRTAPENLNVFFPKLS